MSNVFLVNKASLSYVHYKLNSEYHQKRRLCVQNRSAGCIHSCTDASRQQEISTLCIREQSLSVLSTSLRSEHSPSDIYSFGHTVAACLHPQVSKEKSELDLVQDIQFLGLLLRLDQGRVLLPESKAWEIVAQACKISSKPVLSYPQVPVHGITQLGFRSHPTAPEVITMILSYSGCDRPVYTTASIRPIGSCQPTSALMGPIISHLWNPYSTFPKSGNPPYGWGAHVGDFQILGTWTRSDRKLHINCFELKALILDLHQWAIVLQGH